MALSDGDFEQSARRFRNEVGIDDRFCPDMIFVVNELKKLGKIKDFIRLPDSQMENDAFFDSDERTISVRESIFQTLDHPLRGSRKAYWRARFTIAHELGHVVWSHDGKYARGPTSAMAKSLGSRYGLREIE